ncbi:hypothetical protein [Luteimonas panaciterrae]|uniref:hypothetical protein n=1 Tax=Luteimonas panaciterrae TaxID=363885 RepID=UPI001CFA39C0|nr:hypothetical protein [Luteimonas panaciterrae]
MSRFQGLLTLGLLQGGRPLKHDKSVLARREVTYVATHFSDGSVSLDCNYAGDVDLTGDGSPEHPLRALLSGEQKIAEELRGALQRVSDEYDDRGCVGCGRISAQTLTFVRLLLSVAKGEAP